MTRSRIPPLQTLRAFEAAVRLQSFTRAADELALTQGAVSQHVRALEAQLGHPLFTRERNGAVPTQAAHALALQVRQGLSVLARAFDATKAVRAARASNTTLHVSVLPSVATRWLEPRLPRFRAAHPAIDVVLHPDIALAPLDKGSRIDVALRYGPGAWPGVVAEKLMNETLFPVASPAYRNRDGVAPREAADLARSTLLRHPAQPWEPWFQAARVDLVEPRRAPRFNDVESLIEAVLKGRGVALARRSLIAPELASGALVRVSKVSLADVHAHYVVWRPGHPKARAIAAWLGWLRDEARRKPPRRTSVTGMSVTGMSVTGGRQQIESESS
ncbi:bacterial regulatory helix-turn-helix, lysR family protein [Burkholderia thailandensis MSMB121]|uniref:LysR substrate-binding domain-containing protein n=1 Tax=Burkholderia humptydooensis TaxID=430531 RepID=UPI000327F43C|nr:LysR substrate-binding domain-containing protein [Burkholderia humptydooensis]AGK46766.1 bacterial regulatory helix-turn-helix, lysR family protein [Burkholderia thailandensis MSMB121]ATF35060.1 LysR family transcriptional regulator [Burkholderia thailandensis]KST75634.1 LysR family transcriptional regulator [Burkholderia humptydooensis]